MLRALQCHLNCLRILSMTRYGCNPLKVNHNNPVPSQAQPGVCFAPASGQLLSQLTSGDTKSASMKDQPDGRHEHADTCHLHREDNRCNARHKPPAQLSDDQSFLQLPPPLLSLSFCFAVISVCHLIPVLSLYRYAVESVSICLG